MQFINAGYLESTNNNNQSTSYFLAFQFLWSQETVECLYSHRKQHALKFKTAMDEKIQYAT